MKCDSARKTGFDWNECTITGKPCEPEPAKEDEDERCLVWLQAAADDYGLFDTREDNAGLR